MILNKRAIDLLLAKKKMTVRELIRTSGINAQTYYKGFEEDIYPKTIGKLADALQVEPEEIIIQEEK